MKREPGGGGCRVEGAARRVWWNGCLPIEVPEEQRRQRWGSVSDGPDGHDGSRVGMTEAVRLSPARRFNWRAAGQDEQSLPSVGLQCGFERKESVQDSDKPIQMQKNSCPRRLFQSWLQLFLVTESTSEKASFRESCQTIKERKKKRVRVEKSRKSKREKCFGSKMAPLMKSGVRVRMAGQRREQQGWKCLFLWH